MLKHCKTCRRDLDNTYYADGYKTCSQCLEKKSIKRTNKKLTLKDCQNLAISKNGFCLSTEYINNRTKMEWKCEKGHSWCAVMSDIKNGGKWCPTCAGNVKLTIEECQALAISKGGLCLSNEYKNSRTKMEWECSEHHKWYAVMYDIKNGGKWCPTCAGVVKLTLKDCQDLAISKNGKCLSNEYINNRTKMEWECEKGHKWSARLYNIKLGKWCPSCAGVVKLTLKDCQDVAISKNGKCLSNEYKNIETKIEWECEKGHKWSATMDSVKNTGTWCPNCAGNFKLTLKDCQDLAISKNGKCLSNEYINNRTKMEWECEKGHKWFTSMTILRNLGCWCPTCSGNKSEELCREIFEDNLLEKFPKKRPEWLHGLELDGYNEELNIAFEYNGIQHYEYNEHFHRGDVEIFEAQKERDRMKYRICREKKVNLVIIPYQYDYRNAEELEDYILNELIKFS